MNFVFAFFLRLFICFVAAKLVVLAVDLNSRTYLLSLTVILLVADIFNPISLGL